MEGRPRFELHGQGFKALETLARAWLDGLTPEQRAQAVEPFAARRDWHYVPRSRSGLVLRDMDGRQRHGALALIDAALSESGRLEVRAVMALERVLGELEGRPAYRDPDNYALVVHGQPSAETPWGWRFEGHHLSVAAVLVPGALPAVTPCFFGANPAVVPDHHHAHGDELLRLERERGFALVESLDGARFERCRTAVEAPRDILTGPGHERRLQTPEGVPFAALAEGQKALGWQLVQAFLRHLPEPQQRAHEAQIKEAGLDALHFAWAGGTRLGEPHYFRLHGPVTVIEYDNVQNGANHVHTVWHEPAAIFGDDRLARHHRHDH